MNYIVFDLEWNQATVNEKKVEKLPFEIIEIGAFKLDDNLKKVDEYHRVIKPKYYKKLHHRVSKLVNISKDELSCGYNFDIVAEDFLKFCGKDFIFCVWGSSDVYTLRSNLSFYNINYDFGEPVKYLDVQKLYSFCKYDSLTRVSLKDAVEELKIEKNKLFHRAQEDASYTMQVMKHIPFDKLSMFTTNDLFTIPLTTKKEIHITYEGYYKIISRGFKDQAVLMQNRRIRETFCPYCKTRIKRTINWFRESQNSYVCTAECREHRKFLGKIRLKTNNEKFYAIKILKEATDKDIDRLLEKKAVIREKRKKKKELKCQLEE